MLLITFPNSAAASSLRVILLITPSSLLHAPFFVEQLPSVNFR